jgi:hypothetical protein
VSPDGACDGQPCRAPEQDQLAREAEGRPFWVSGSSETKTYGKVTMAQ